ncbi:unknown [Prevotella sp. CAG:1124]|nr:unknown [Prevotella sp. CAG:1124]
MPTGKNRHAPDRLPTVYNGFPVKSLAIYAVSH